MDAYVLQSHHDLHGLSHHLGDYDRTDSVYVSVRCHVRDRLDAHVSFLHANEVYTRYEVYAAQGDGCVPLDADHVSNQRVYVQDSRHAYVLRLHGCVRHPPGCPLLPNCDAKCHTMAAPRYALLKTDLLKLRKLLLEATE